MADSPGYGEEDVVIKEEIEENEYTRDTALEKKIKDMRSIKSIISSAEFGPHQVAEKDTKEVSATVVDNVHDASRKINSSKKATD